MKFSLQALHLKVTPVVEEANRLMLKGFSEEVEIFTKKAVQFSTSVLTQTDKDMSVLLMTRLKKKFPEFGFLTEEHEDINPKEDFAWVIDEIDGTANFANRLPVFSTSISLWDLNKNIPVYGVISFPIQKEIIHAIYNGGMYLNNKKVTRKVPKRSHVTAVYGYVGTSEEKVQFLKTLIKVIPCPETYRCATFHLSMTALGRIDCAVLGNCAIWDIAAGICIAKEAGLEVKFISKKPSLTSPTSRDYKNWLVVSEKPLAEKVAGVLKEVYCSK